MVEKTRIVVVDDHALLRAGLVRALALDPMIEIVGEGASATDAIELARIHAPDLILLDISMPGNGIEAARAIRDLPSAPRVVMLTVSADDDDVMRALEAGAVGYILKGIDARDIIMAVTSVKAGGSFMSPDLALRLLSNNAQVQANPLLSLSELEKRILSLISEGLTTRKVSEKLDLTDKSIEFHVTNILKKFSATNRVGAALIPTQLWGEFESSVKLH
ncbi:response regulator transcription factor [Microvirga sp. VF16]|uniref:response regulator n=1 Tax=Microvirga sp. VF16 TaxID=2807101 RepID=UPI00193E4CCE|nr:response regulator transcription factor [Microvirga sp. VF16]QRM31580.1 response regulator transcription factor [Microvirga sp. VF16]